MALAHHSALLTGYATAIVMWLVLRAALPRLWPRPQSASFERPWREFGWAVLAACGVIVIGQLYQRGWLLPTTGAGGRWLDTVNQVLLYSPMWVLLLYRGHPASSAWLPLERVPVRLVCGAAIALVALAAFAWARGPGATWSGLVVDVYRPAHIRFAVHVFLEDVSIAIVFVRLAAATRRPVIVPVVIALLFAVGHIPGALAAGATARELLPLLLDFGLGIGVLLVVARSADVWWFCNVHFALDMTQFAT